MLFAGLAGFGVFAGLHCDTAVPFAVAAIEQSDLIAGLQPHDVKQIMCVLGARFDNLSRPQIGFDVKARGIMIFFVRHFNHPELALDDPTVSQAVYFNNIDYR